MNVVLVNLGMKNGIPQFEEQSKKYGLDIPSFSTQSSFFDYDRDGDLDMFLNHRLHPPARGGEPLQVHAPGHPGPEHEPVQTRLVPGKTHPGVSHLQQVRRRVGCCCGCAGEYLKRLRGGCIKCFRAHGRWFVIGDPQSG